MSTEIKSAAGKVRINREPDERIGIRTFDSAAVLVDVRSVPRADFLSAVEKECDVVVVPKNEMPGVTRRHNGCLSAGHEEELDHRTAEEYREAALLNLALAEYLDSHPPVDEAQVEKLAKALAAEFFDADPVDEDRARARHLYAAGVRIEGGAK